MKQKQKEERGITLIALIITIIILVLLAAISISAVVDSRIVDVATNGAANYAKEQLREEEEFNKTVNVIDEYVKKYGGGENPDKPEKPAEWTSDKVTPIPDGKGGVIPLPDGYYYVGGDIDTGIVISDKPGDTMDATFPNSGNQFVWVPVESEAELERTWFNENGQPTLEMTVEYTEPYSYNGATGYPGEADEYNDMKSKILQYGGFYIGRYESGVASTTFRTGATVAQNVVCQRGVAPYNYVPWGKSMTDAGEVEGQSGAVYLAKNKYSHPDSVVSTLCYGSQWDAMCRYIGDGNRTTPQKQMVELTGSVASDVSKNIYDLAGNCWEWTMEAAGGYDRIGRGGAYNDKNTQVSDRGEGGNTDFGGENDMYSFRVTLYIA